MVPAVRSQPFRAWLQAQLELRGIVGPVEAARVLGIDDSTLSRYLGGSRVPQRRGVIALARALRIPITEVQDAADADPGRVDLERPPPPVQDQLEEIRLVIGQIAERLRRDPPPTVEGPLPPPMRVQAAGPFRDTADGGPVIVRDPRLLDAVDRAASLVVWIIPATGPQPGYWVRVGTADPPVIKPYEPGDDVTGVVDHLQAVVRA
jgi:transcriptional regulator with XRE-family HTH domain